MVFLIIIAVLLLSILLWLLFVSIIIEIDTEGNIYRISIGKNISASFLHVTGGYRIRIHIPGWDFNINPFIYRKSKKIANTERTKTGKVHISHMLKVLIRMLQSFRVRLFQVNLDTGDYFWNAILIPAFSLANTKDRYMYVNFMGQNSVHIILEDRMIRFLWAWIITR